MSVSVGQVCSEWRAPRHTVGSKSKRTESFGLAMLIFVNCLQKAAEARILVCEMIASCRTVAVVGLARLRHLPSSGNLCVGNCKALSGARLVRRWRTLVPRQRGHARGVNHMHTPPPESDGPLQPDLRSRWDDGDTFRRWHRSDQRPRLNKQRTPHKSALARRVTKTKPRRDGPPRNHSLSLASRPALASAHDGTAQVGGREGVTKGESGNAHPCCPGSASTPTGPPWRRQHHRRQVCRPGGFVSSHVRERWHASQPTSAPPRCGAGGGHPAPSLPQCRSRRCSGCCRGP